MLFGKRERLIRRILVVEDEPLVAFDNEHMLGDAGYEVVATVDTVADALRVIADEALDLVLSDVTLSGEGSGLDVAAAARNKGVPLLFVTGAKPPGAEALAIGWLAKPYNARALKAALDAADRLLGGEKARRRPTGFELFGPPAG